MLEKKIKIYKFSLMKILSLRINNKTHKNTIKQEFNAIKQLIEDTKEYLNLKILKLRILVNIWNENVK